MVSSSSVVVSSPSVVVSDASVVVGPGLAVGTVGGTTENQIYRLKTKVYGFFLQMFVPETVGVIGGATDGPAAVVVVSIPAVVD